MLGRPTAALRAFVRMLLDRAEFAIVYRGREFIEGTIMYSWKNAAVAAVGAVALSSVVSTARADFLLESQSLSIDKKSQVADFSLTFNQTPDFATLDALGPANSFQIDFNG